MSDNPSLRERDFADPRIPDRDDCVLRYLVDRWAEQTPDRPHVVWEDGEVWSFAEVRRRTIAKAAGLAALGVGQGDFVAVWLPNGRDALLAFHAVAQRRLLAHDARGRSCRSGL